MRGEQRVFFDDSGICGTAPRPSRSSGTKWSPSPPAVGHAHPADAVARRAGPPLLTTRVLARQRGEQLGLTVARDAGDPDDLARAHVEPTSLRETPNPSPQGSDSQRTSRATSPGAAAAALGAAGPRRSSSPRACVGLLARVHDPVTLAAPQHRATVAERADLVELVADVEDRAAPGRGSLRRVSKSLSAACGVSTEVGSSRISSLGLASSARTISTRCRSPTESDVHRPVGSTVEPVLGRPSADPLRDLARRHRARGPARCFPRR